MWSFKRYCLYYIMGRAKDIEKTNIPKHRMEMSPRILADIELMFEDPNDSNLEAFEEFKNTLIKEEMYMMLKQLHNLEIEYKIKIPFKV